MKCRKVRLRIPLLLDGNIDMKKRAALENHLKGCPSCREEYRSMASSLSAVAEGLREHRPEWDEPEWRRVVRNAVSEKRPDSTRGFSSLKPKKWSLAAAAVFAFLLIVFLSVPLFKGTPAEQAAGTRAGEQDMVSMTMVSKETGLQIVWVFNKNFSLEDKK